MKITNNTIFNFETNKDTAKVVYREEEKRVVVYLKPIAMGYKIAFALSLNKEKHLCILSEEKPFSQAWAELFANAKEPATKDDMFFLRDEVAPLLLEWMYILELLNTLERIDTLDEEYIKNIAKVLDVPNNKEAVVVKLLDELAEHEPFEKMGLA